jgi:transposase
VAAVVIGVDPHKLSATIEVLDQRERVLGGGRFGTDRVGYRQLLTAAQPVAGSGLGGRGQ